MKKLCALLLCLPLLLAALAGCGPDEPAKIGVAFGVGPAVRWPQEIELMQEYALELGVSLTARLNTDEAAKPFTQDCIELIDSGIDVLIVRPRDIHGMGEVVAYAHAQKVKIISYDSLIAGEAVDLFVGYDGEHTGQQLGRYLAEIVPSGDYILLWGDQNRNVEEMYRGAMRYLNPSDGQIHILLESGVPGWSPEEGKRIVKEAIAANGNHVDAIFAFNDKLAGACAEAVAELGIETPVAIAGMDAELDAVKRIIAGTQSCTAYMDLRDITHTAILEAINLAAGKKIVPNSELDNGSAQPIPTYLLSRQLVTPANLDRVLIESGHYTAQEVYGTDG